MIDEKEYRDKLNDIDEHFDELSNSVLYAMLIELQPAVKKFENDATFSSHNNMIRLLGSVKED